MRPPTARPRTTDGHDAEPAPPPTRAEVEAIERHLVTLTELSGATATADGALASLIVRSPGHGPAFNYAALIRWSDVDWQERARTFSRSFVALGETPTVLIAEGLTQPADLEHRLAGAGWAALDGETIMWTRTPAVVPHLDPTLRIEAVTHRSAEEYEALERDIFGLASWFARERTAHLVRGIEAGRLRAFLVRVRGQAAAVARVSAGDGMAALYGVGVAREHRGQGLGRLVTTVATRAGLATGNRLVWLSVDEGNTRAVSLYRSLGFQPAFRWARLAGRVP